ncbi:hypothetical protein GIB67_029357 [Kingdonia uniflora]|uniref:DUF4283 domain-containing protein n=1 Tax=Kingdonia uniflora TaxID=39325 RepID=A0A7J7M581_9MAGN|nr:hypothetical protein GIB67_029357 [Kingdonia uniflora]
MEARRESLMEAGDDGLKRNDAPISEEEFHPCSPAMAGETKKNNNNIGAVREGEIRRSTRARTQTKRYQDDGAAVATKRRNNDGADGYLLELGEITQASASPEVHLCMIEMDQSIGRDNQDIEVYEEANVEETNINSGAMTLYDDGNEEPAPINVDDRSCTEGVTPSINEGVVEDAQIEDCPLKDLGADCVDELDSAAVSTNEELSAREPAIHGQVSHSTAEEFPALPSTSKTSENNYTSSKPSWAQMLGAPSASRGKVKLIYTPPTLIRGIGTAKMNSSNFEDNIKNSESIVVENFIGKRLPYKYLKDSLSKVWGFKSDFEMTLKRNNNYFFRFGNDEDRERVLEMGSFHLASRMFIIRPWRPFIEFEPTEVSSIPIWVILKDVPDQFMNDEGIGLIASIVGKPLCLDRASEEKKHKSFIRVCVEVEVSSLLPRSLPLLIDEKFTINVIAEYNWVRVKCIDCNVFGHSSMTFPIKAAEFQAKKAKDEENKKMRIEAENKEGFQVGNKKSVISKNNEHQKGKEVEKKDGWEYPKYTAKKSASTNNVGITAFIPVDLTEEIEEMNENPHVSNIKQGDLARSVSFNKLVSCSNSTRACSGLNEKAKEATTLEKQRVKEAMEKEKKEQLAKDMIIFSPT